MFSEKHQNLKLDIFPATRIKSNVIFLKCRMRLFMFIFVIIAQLKQDNYIANKQQIEISIALCFDKEGQSRGLMHRNQEQGIWLIFIMIMLMNS